MAQEKKRLSKKAKEALKILNDSQLLANSKTQNEAKSAQNFAASDEKPKLSTANKPRPDKKRG